VLAAEKDDMLVDGPQASAAVIRDILAGKEGTPRNIVAINAAAALYAAGAEESMQTCAERAPRAIDGGAANEQLARLVEVSHS